MFGWGGKKKGGGGNGVGRKGKDEDAELEGMIMDPEEMMRGLENDPELMKELRDLGIPDDDEELQAALGGSAAKAGGSRPKQPSAKAAGKPTAEEAFLANLNMSALEDAEGLGLIDEDNMKLDDSDLDDTGLLAELGGLGWKDGDTPREGEDEEDHSGESPKGEEPRPSPPAPQPPAQPSNQDHIRDVEAKIAEAKTKALTLRKEGKTEEAMQEFKKLKQLEAELGVRTTLGVVSDVAKAAPIPQHDDDDDDPQPPTPTSGGSIDNKAGGSGGNNDGDMPPAPPGVSSVSQQRLVQLRTEAENKRKAALQMRKEGHMEEALSFMREAKALDAELARLMKRSSSRSLIRRSSSVEETTPKAGSSSPARSTPSTGSSSAAPPPATSGATTSSSATAAAPAAAPVVAAKPAPPKPPVRDAFTPLEEALTEAVAMTKKAAIALKDKDKKAAVEELKRSKEYDVELETLRAKRATPGAAPAPFQWQVTSRKFQKVLQDVPVDSLQLIITDGKELYGTRRDNTPVKDKVFVSYDMGYPKDKPHTGHTALVHTNADVSATFNFKTFVPLSRSKAEVLAFTRKSVVLHVQRKKGLLIKSDELMTEARIELAPLLDHCEIITDAPLFKEGTRRPCGGHLSVTLRIREPLKDVEIVEEQIRTLVLGPWPDLSSTPLMTTTITPATTTTAATTTTPATGGGAAATTTPISPRPTSTVRPQQQASAAEPKPVTQKPAVIEAEDERFNVLTPLERQQPLSPECVVSNDVFEYEIQLLATNPDKLDENDLAIREAQLNMRMNILVLKVQREELSLDQYTAMVRERMERDRLLARLLTKEGRKAEAIRVLKRVKIMEQELASAAEGGEG